MQRQSLGSPVTKLQSHGLLSKEDDLAEEQQKRKVSMVTDEEDNKIDKLKRSPPKPEKLIHLIPILTMLCFLVLYLCSHDPSQKDLAHFTGVIRSSKVIDSAEDRGFKRFIEVDKGDMLAIRSLRNLQEIGRYAPKYRLHRKFADF